MNKSYLAPRVASSRSVAGTPVRVGKFPPITPWFWVLTVLAAGIGQAVADWLIGTGDGLPGLLLARRPTPRSPRRHLGNPPPRRPRSGRHHTPGTGVEQRYLHRTR